MASSDEETFYTPQRSAKSAYSDSPSSPISRQWCRKLVGDGEGAARGGARAVELGLGGRRPALVDEAAQAAGCDERRSREARGQLRHHRRVAPPQPLILLHQRRCSSYVGDGGGGGGRGGAEDEEARRRGGVGLGLGVGGDGIEERREKKKRREKNI
uniref:Uncharacterized protein n=1 Tax=Ananas comosus var. bracteatus TaxID=296719 RepID=A0A6V7NX08_ANACO|nr:unnamed protein product [Ananas comosus var. bracteatus]